MKCRCKTSICAISQTCLIFLDFDLLHNNIIILIVVNEKIYGVPITYKLDHKVACERGHRLGFLFGIWILGPQFQPNCI